MAPQMHTAVTPYTDDEIAMMAGMLNMIGEELIPHIPPRFAALIRKIQQDAEEARAEMAREAEGVLIDLIQTIARAEAHK